MKVAKDYMLKLGFVFLEVLLFQIEYFTVSSNVEKIQFNNILRKYLRNI